MAVADGSRELAHEGTGLLGRGNAHVVDDHILHLADDVAEDAVGLRCLFGFFTPYVFINYFLPIIVNVGMTIVVPMLYNHFYCFFPSVSVVFEGLVDAYAADFVAVAIEGAGEGSIEIFGRLFPMEVNVIIAYAGEVILGAVGIPGSVVAVGDVGTQLEVAAIVPFTLVDTPCQQVKLIGGVNHVGVSVRAAACPLSIGEDIVDGGALVAHRQGIGIGRAAERGIRGFKSDIVALNCFACVAKGETHLVVFGNIELVITCHATGCRNGDTADVVCLSGAEEAHR